MRLNNNDTDEVPGRPSFRRPPLGGDYAAAMAAQLLDAQETHRALIGSIGDLGKILDQITPHVIGVQTVVLDANGSAAVQYRVPFRALAVDSQSTSLLTIANSTLQSAAPNAGPGVALIRPGGSTVLNFRAYQWSIYGGSPGDKVTVTAFANPQAAAASSSVPVTAAAATLTNVVSSAASVNLFPAAGTVNGRLIFNDSTATLYVKYGAVASITSYTVQVLAGGYYEFPTPRYSGQVDGIWAAANGNARLTNW